nr:transposase, MuDR, MULE transposase domain protein [Tanacetum cinerariifolium]
MISKDYKKETDVKVGKIFDNKEALDLAIRLKALDEGYQFLNDRSAPERHDAIALAVQDEFPLSYHDVCCRHLMMNLSLKRDKTKALFWRICKAYTTEEFSRSMSHLQDIQTDAYDKLCQKAASVKVSRDLSSNGARVVLSTSQTH